MAVLIGNDVAEIAQVTFGRVRASMFFVGGVVVTSCGGSMRAAAVTMFMDVKAVFTWC